MPRQPAIFRLPTLIAACVLLVACGSPINQENFNKIQTGMTLEEVQSILGKPAESSSADFGGISGGSATWKHDEAVITVQLVNGKVQFKQYTSNENE
ncbi:MAG: DUF3862 domain-containing protein [Gammaproteobacteria bacterium]|nr:DUF3862 domain-containing protein [Gammaproteobacteria bacterium]